MTGKLWPLLIGFTVWALAFVAVYAVQGLGCAWLWPPFWHRVILLAITVTVLTILVILLVWQRRQTRSNASTINVAAFRLTTCALVASIVTFTPTAFASTCV